LLLAQETAVAAGNEVRQLLNQPRKISSKGFRDLVTDADLVAQRIITETILHAFPDHGFLPEEKDSDLPTEGPIIWIIDPVDGTTNYSRSQPNFAVSVGAALPLFDEQEALIGFEPLAGAIYDPMRDELFSAATGKGAFLQKGNEGYGRKTPLHVSQIASLDEALLLLDFPGPVERRLQTMTFMNEMAPHVFTIRNLGSATLALAWLAAGRADGYFNVNLRPWDLAAAHVILKEAGGILTTIHDQPLHWLAEVMDCFASNGRVHPLFIAKINGLI
jgi:myo-inositol-1(or 4)-monophosphatase